MPDILFANPFPRKRLDHESKKSGFRFHPKYVTRVCIIWAHDPFLDSRICFPPKNVLCVAVSVGR